MYGCPSSSISRLIVLSSFVAMETPFEVGQGVGVPRKVDVVARPTPRGMPGRSRRTTLGGAGGRRYHEPTQPREASDGRAAALAEDVTGSVARVAVVQRADRGQCA